MIGKDLEAAFLAMPRKIILQDIVSKEELKEKLQKAFKMKTEEYCIR